MALNRASRRQARQWRGGATPGVLQSLRGEIEKKIGVRLSYLPVILVALTALAITWMAYDKVSAWAFERMNATFAAAAGDRILVIQRELDHAVALVQDLANLFEASGRISRREFRKFVGPALRRHPGIRTLEWVPQVRHEDLKTFLDSARSSFPRYQITEPGADGTVQPVSTRSIYYPVLYVQPYQENREQLGLDLGASPATVSAFQSAMTSGATQVALDKRGGSQPPELIVRVPVYTSEQDLEAPVYDEEVSTPSEERDPLRLRGFTIGRLIVGESIERALLALNPSGIDMRFVARTESGEEIEIYEHRSRVSATLPSSADVLSGAAPPQTVELDLAFANQRWTVSCESQPGYFLPESSGALIVFVNGIGFTVLLTLYLLTLITRAETVSRLVEERTGQLVSAIQALKRQVIERKKAESELQRLNDTLEQRIAERSQEANRRANELEQFAYVASHDLKAPLRGIANLAQWLQEDLEEKLAPESREQLDLLRDRVGRMQNLIEGLLEYSRIGRVPAESGEVDVGDLLNEIADSLAPPKGFQIKLPKSLPTLRTSRLHLSQVFSNLLSNAIKHHGKKRGRIWVEWADIGDNIRFSVCDDGQGIAPEFQSKIFLMFQTLAISDRNTNTGIGLALVKKIVEEHGGTIYVRSDRGDGSRFIFTWPKRDPFK